MKLATTIDQQIETYKSRGMIFDDEEKAKEQLLDIGYFRLGTYCFPFEKTFPETGKKRSHEYIEGTKFKDIIDLYYFDSDLRYILMKYLNRIEINFREFLIYTVSNEYRGLPTWFASPNVVFPRNEKEIKRQGYTIEEEFEKEVYNSRSIKYNPIIEKHHDNYINDKFAPAWKTMEYMTFGNIISLYRQLKNSQLKRKIAGHYGCTSEKNFRIYLKTIKVIRNACAHGGCLYDTSLDHTIAIGAPIDTLLPKDNKNINGAIEVIKYIVGKISANRRDELTKEIDTLLKVNRSPCVGRIISECTSIKSREE